MRPKATSSSSSTSIPTVSSVGSAFNTSSISASTSATASNTTPTRPGKPHRYATWSSVSGHRSGRYGFSGNSGSGSSGSSWNDGSNSLGQKRPSTHGHGHNSHNINNANANANGAYGNHGSTSAAIKDRDFSLASTDNTSNGNSSSSTDKSTSGTNFINIKLERTPVMARNANGRRYTREELLDILVNMKRTGQLVKAPPIDFPQAPSSESDAAHAIKNIWVDRRSNIAGVGSKEYEKFSASELLDPELLHERNENVSHISHSPSSNAAAITFKDTPVAESLMQPVRTTSPLLNSIGVAGSSNVLPGKALQSRDDSQQQSLLSSTESIIPSFNALELGSDSFVTSASHSVSNWSSFNPTTSNGIENPDIFSRPTLFAQDKFNILGPVSPSAHPIPPVSQPGSGPLPPGLMPPMLIPAPFLQWVYKDNSGVIQGPFSGLMMHDWYMNGWLDGNLEIMRAEENSFYRLAEFCERIGNFVEPFLIPLPPIEVQNTNTSVPMVPTLSQNQLVSDNEVQSSNMRSIDGAVSLVEAGNVEINNHKSGDNVTVETSNDTMFEATLQPAEISRVFDDLSKQESSDDISNSVTEDLEQESVKESRKDSSAINRKLSSSNVAQTTTSKHKLQPLPPPPVLSTKIGGQDISSSTEKQITTHSSVPIAPWAKATEKKTKTLSLKEIEEREKARIAKLKQQQEALTAALSKPKMGDIDLTNGNSITGDLSGSHSSSNAMPPGLPRMATWAKSSSGSGAAVPKKTLAEIQKEEEEAAAARAKKISGTIITNGVMTAQGKKYAEIMSRPSQSAVRLPSTPVMSSTSGASNNGGAWTTVGPGGKKATPVGTPTIVRRSMSSSASSLVSTPAPKGAIVKPSISADEFIKWCRLTLKGINSGVNSEELLNMLMSLPVSTPDTTEIIADTIYTNSTTMDGRRFAEEFVRRRKAVELAGGDTWAALGSVASTGGLSSNLVPKSTGSPSAQVSEGWNEVLVKSNARTLKQASGTGGNDGWNTAFKVVGNKKRVKK
ncbi:hypothetical protein V1511DRAFT_168766 [Dipodascopsis uninucleata]